jgi:hypothetical protein
VAQNERESREADKMATEIVRDTLARRRRKVSVQPTFIAASSHLSDPYLRLLGEVTNWFILGAREVAMGLSDDVDVVTGTRAGGG